MIQVRFEPGTAWLPSTVLWCLPVFEGELPDYNTVGNWNVCHLLAWHVRLLHGIFFSLSELLWALSVERQSQVSPGSPLHPIGLILGVSICEPLPFQAPSQFAWCLRSKSTLSAIWGYFGSAQRSTPCWLAATHPLQCSQWLTCPSVPPVREFLTEAALLKRKDWNEYGGWKKY